MPQETMSTEQVKRAAKSMNKAQLEQRFLEAWRRLFPRLPVPTMQYQFHPTRRWRFDFCFIPEKLAVEVDGGAYIAGRHSRPIGQKNDNEKMNNAVKLGWRVLRFNTVDFKDPEYVAEFVAEVFTNAREVT
jgi:very-short-patch-repair endonuclease